MFQGITATTFGGMLPRFCTSTAWIWPIVLILECKLNLASVKSWIVLNIKYIHSANVHVRDFFQLHDDCCLGQSALSLIILSYRYCIRWRPVLVAQHVSITRLECCFNIEHYDDDRWFFNLSFPAQLRILNLRIRSLLRIFAIFWMFGSRISCVMFHADP